MIYGEFCAFFGSFLPFFSPYLACILAAHLANLFCQRGNHIVQKARGSTRQATFLWGLAHKNGA